MLSGALRVALVIALVYTTVAALAYAYQDRLAFPAPRRVLPEPAAAGLPDGERVTLETADGLRLSGWFLPPTGVAEPAPAVLWFYGNMETVADLGPAVRWLRPHGVGVLILDYRGYGESEGSPTEEGLYRDAEAAWAFLLTRSEVDPTRIGVYGRSLGSAVGLYVATSHPVRAVALDAPFSNAQDMRKLHYFFFPGFLLKHRLDNVARARALEAPLLVFHGVNDRIAPLRMGRAVAEAGRARQLVAIDGAGHNDTYDRGGARYRDTLFAFWDAHLR